MRKRLADMAPVLVVAVGLLILLYPTISNFLIERNASRAVAAYDEAAAALDDTRYEQMLADARTYNRQLAAREGIGEADGGGDAASVSTEELSRAYSELLNLNGDGMMGYISIPTLDVTLPIYHTVEEKVLQVGVGHIETSSLPVGGASTRTSLSGHRGLPSAKLFTELDRMQEGDVFYIRVLRETFAYQVDGVETVLPSETESLAIQAGEDRCTLVTCTPYGINSHRLLVHAHAIPYVPEMEAAVGNPGFFINISLPHALLIAAVVVIGAVFAALRLRSRRLEGDSGPRKRGGSHFASILAWGICGALAASLYGACPEVASAATAVSTAGAPSPLPDGSLSLVCEARGADGSTTPLVGDTYALVRVAALSEDVSGFSSITEEPFSTLDRNWLTLDAAGLRAAAHEASGHAHTNGLLDTAATASSDALGRASFGRVPAGVYLLERVAVTPGNEAYLCDPVLVSVPALEGDLVVYDVTASLKFEWDETPSTPGDPNNPVAPDDTPSENPLDDILTSLGLPKTGDATLAYTALLALLAIAALYAGARIRRSRRSAASH